MRLPGPLYECLPYAYVVVGVLFLMGSVYIGPGNVSLTMHLALGVFSLVSGILVGIKRIRSRGVKSRASSRRPAK